MLKLIPPQELGPVDPAGIQEFGTIYERAGWPFHSAMDSTAEDILQPIVTTVLAYDPNVKAMAFVAVTGAVPVHRSQINKGWHFDGRTVVAADVLPTEFALGRLPSNPALSTFMRMAGNKVYESQAAQRHLSDLSDDELAVKGIGTHAVRANTLNFLSERTLHRSGINRGDAPVKRNFLGASLYY